MTYGFLFVLFLCIILLITQIKLEKGVKRNRIKEKVLMEIKGKTPKWYIGMSVILIIIFLAMNPTKVTFSFLLIKISIISSLFYLSDLFTKKFILTQHSAYIIDMFQFNKEKRFQKLKKEEWYRIEYKKKTGSYTIYFMDEEKYAKQIPIVIEKYKDILLFKHIAKTYFEFELKDGIVETLPDENPKSSFEKELLLREKSANLLDHTTSTLVITMICFALFSIIDSIGLLKNNVYGFSKMLSTVIAVQFIPCSLFLMIWTIVKKGEVNRESNKFRVKQRHLWFIYTFCSLTVPFNILMNHGITDEKHILIAEWSGFLFMTVLLSLSWISGIVIKKVKLEN